MTTPGIASPTFRDLGLPETMLAALDEIGYEVPSTIQAQSIPHLLAGRDLVGQAQTGTGKTAAFALPILSKLKPGKHEPQVLVLVPTRELAIQVAEAFQRYAAHIPGFHVLPIYGGQGYGDQLRQLKRGVQVIVGTPGRLCDHLRRGTLEIDSLDVLVIDEADEMLRMGFIDEVEWILQQTPAGRQTCLFSATMPDAIRNIAKRYLNNPVEVTIKSKTSTASTIRQRYWLVSGLHKLDALTRILEGETFESMIVFVRTKNATTDLATKLEARGFSCAPLSGDISQSLREATIDKLRNGEIDILVATDVAARGLDVSRISHVVNYDIPNDTESYIHRIGRTGRAGRTGEAILFVAPREKRLLQAIERASGQKIELMELPSRETINDIRLTRFRQRITDTRAVEELGFFYQLVEEYCKEHNVPPLEVAAALAKMVQGDEPLLLTQDRQTLPAEDRSFDRPSDDRRRPSDRGDRGERGSDRRPSSNRAPAEGTVRYRLDVGRVHGVKPGQIVGAIANEGGLDGEQIRRIDIQMEHSTVELPAGMSAEALKNLRKTRVCGRPIKLRPATEGDAPAFKKFDKPRKDRP